jgi:hypothetical protein
VWGAFPEHAHGDIVSGHDAGRRPRKVETVVPAVKTDRHAPRYGLLSFGEDHVREGLRSMADHMDVHAVKPRAHDTPKPGRSKL